jgi:hypothetical protein
VNALNQQNGTFYGTLPLAFANYNMTNGELRGANVTITNFNWLGGQLNSENANSNTVTIPPAARSPSAADRQEPQRLLRRQRASAHPSRRGRMERHCHRDGARRALH